MDSKKFHKLKNRLNNYRFFVKTIFVIVSGIVGLLSAAACSQNTEPTANREKVAEQQKSEANTENNTAQSATTASPKVAETMKPPKVYQANCAKCHGANGEGKDDYPPLAGVTTRAEDSYSDEELLEIINSAKEFGLSSKMPSFQKKLTEEEKLEIIKWLKTLK